jgi:hypothetical protein
MHRAVLLRSLQKGRQQQAYQLPSLQLLELQLVRMCATTTASHRLPHVMALRPATAAAAAATAAVTSSAEGQGLLVGDPVRLSCCKPRAALAV